MTPAAPSSAAVLEVFDALDPPGTPVTTMEVAERFDCTSRTIYNRLNALVDEGVLETKKVGARGRVWWRPATTLLSEDQSSDIDLRHATLESMVDRHYTRDIGIYTLDTDLRLSYLNNRAEEWLNTPTAEVRGEFIWDVFERDERADDVFQAALNTRKSTHFLTYYEPWRRWFDNHVYPSDSGLSVYFTDVTERKKAEVERERTVEALHESQERFRLATKAANIYTWEADVANDRFEWSESAEDLVDFPLPDSVEGIRANIPTEYRDKVRTAFEQAIEECGDFSYETPYRNPDTGEINWIYSAGKAVADSGDSADRVLGVSQDITARKRLEESLRRNEERYRTLFKSISEGFCILEVLFNEDSEPMDYRFLETNPAFEEMTELTNVIGERRRELDRGYDQRWFDIYGKVAQTGEPERFETRGQPPTDGWYDIHVFPYGGQDSRKIALLINDISARKQLEQELRAEKEKLDIAVESSPAILFQLDTDLRYRWIKNPHEDFDRRSMIGKRDDELLPPIAAEAVMAPKQAVLESGKGVRKEVTYGLPSGEVTYDLTVEPLRDESEEIIGLTCAALDVTEIKYTQGALERLTDASRTLMRSNTEKISDLAADITLDVLDVEYTDLWRYDETTGDLRRHASRIDPGIGFTEVQFPEGFSDRIWQTFLSDDLDVFTDILPDSERSSSELLVRSSVLIPLGRHGVICAGSTNPETFDPTRIDLAETLASTIETGLDRAESEQELERNNEELTRLDRLNTLIRQIDQALVEAETVSAIDEAVCDRLADSALYKFAWIGDYNAVSETVEPRAWAGIDSSYVDEITSSSNDLLTDKSPFVAAIRTREVQVIPDLAINARAAPWRARTLERGVRSCLSIPLIYDEYVYGVLAVYGEGPQHDERDVDILAELGQTVAHAINAAETKTTFQTDSTVEITLRTTAANTPLCRLTRQLKSSIRFEGLVPISGGDAIVFFTVTDISKDEFLTASQQSFALDELTCLAEGEGSSLFKAKVTDPLLASLLVEQGAVIRLMTIDAGTATVVVDLSQTNEVRAFIDKVQGSVPDLELLARQTHTRPIETRDTFQQTFEDNLTVRQWEVLHTAYRSGFFQWPRLQTGQELSKTLDVSQATFAHHLREAERKLCELVFDTSESRDLTRQKS